MDDARGRSRTLVKVCGLTRLEDARDALASGADWLGFIVHGESPRRIEPETVAEIARELPGAEIVAVMVGLDAEEALAIARRAGAQRLQLHRVDPSRWPPGFAMPTAFAVSVTEQGTLRGSLPQAPHLTLLDTAHETLAGGTGRAFPWSIAAALAAVRPVMLAGGLGADNVAEAIRQVKPFGVDASSRLESSPGLKDAELVRRFVAAVREWDERSPDTA